MNTGVSGIPNGINEDGEDVNSNGTLEIYGMTPMAGAGGAPLDPTATVYGTVLNAVARTNPPIFFRRALKLVNGGLGNLPVAGLTVTSENPVYVQGYYNANASGFGDPHASAAIIADAVTLLSIAWNDWNSLDYPHDPPDALPTYYRFTVATGTSRSYARPGGTPIDFGTDGGVQNLLRLLEDWTGDTLYHLGSLAPLWISRQARGSYKCCINVFVPPATLAFEHDSDFLDMTKQPPGTPYISGHQHHRVPADSRCAVAPDGPSSQISSDGADGSTSRSLGIIRWRDYEVRSGVSGSAGLSPRSTPSDMSASSFISWSESLINIFISVIYVVQKSHHEPLLCLLHWPV